MTFFDSKSIQVQCSVGGRSDSDRLARRFEDYSRSVFTLVANSVVVQDKWTGAVSKAATTPRKKQGRSNSETLYSLFGSDRSMFYLVLAVSFVMTWGLGLAPAFIARYAVYKRPLSKSAASWIAGISCFIFAVLFAALNAAEGQRSHVAVWVFVFFVSRWIMTRESSSLPEPRPPSP